MKLTRASQEVVLYQGDDLARIQEFVQRLRRAGASLSTRMDDDEDAVETIRAEYDAFIPGAVERGATVRVEALPGRKYRALVAEHPPRQPVRDEDGKVTQAWPEDYERGFNVETMADPLVVACTPADQFGSIGDRDAFLDDLSDGNFSRLYSAAVHVNEESGPDPKARLSSQPAQTSGETSESPERMD